MIPIDLPETEGTRKVVFAQEQPQYEPLPALIYPEGYVLSQWKPTLEERGAILDGADVYLWVWTFGRPLQPVNLSVQGVTYENANEGPETMTND